MLADDPYENWRMLPWNRKWGFDPEDDQKIIDKAAIYGWTGWELTDFDAIWYGQGQGKDRDFLARNAFGLFVRRNPQAIESTIDRCFREGWIQYLTSGFILEMQQEIQHGGYLTPNGLFGEKLMNELKMVDHISFTRMGVSMYMDFFDSLRPMPRSSHTVMRVVGDTSYTYTTSLKECVHSKEIPPDCEVESIGRWCDRWWQRFESGYCIRKKIEPWIRKVK